MQVLSVVGPTAVGKTAFALTLAKSAVERGLYKGADLISADSRQVYKGLKIISGADLPFYFSPLKSSFSPHPFFQSQTTRIHGIAIIEPTDEWSVSHFQQFALPIVQDSLANHRLPIIVGGTGLYHDHLFETDPQLHIGPNEMVRRKAEKMSVAQLQEWLQKIDADRFSQLNHSDQLNPRRLIRAIEVTLNATEVPSPSTDIPLHFYVGLQDDRKIIEQRIKQRVRERFEQGAIAEVEQLMKAHADWSLPAFSATGVIEIKQFLEGKLSQQACLDLWALHEFQYAKRQLTWWKKKPVQWFNVSQPRWQQTALESALKI